MTTKDEKNTFFEGKQILMNKNCDFSFEKYQIVKKKKKKKNITKLKKSNCRFFLFKLWQNSKTLTMTKFLNLNGDKTQNSDLKKTQKLKLWQYKKN